ncbi:MAG TPA: polymer-forming cytoskeletal protein [Candidatus Binataceae bacterium]|nr:polymer-forming cytoskeletal protein [Candidatus Binataceae bacterium]
MQAGQNDRQPAGTRQTAGPNPAGVAKPAIASTETAGHWTEQHTRVAVGRNVNVSGKLIFNEPVRIEGHFRGEARSTELVVIAEGGMIEGKVFAPRLLVMGELRGDVAGCERMMVGARARVIGNIDAGALTICEGAWLDGHVKMSGASEKKGE